MIVAFHVILLVFVAFLALCVMAGIGRIAYEVLKGPKL